MIRDVFEAGTFRVEGKVWVSGRGVVRSPSVEVRVSTNGTG